MAAPAARPSRVVAELGRPETAEETADRKAEASRTRRANQTLFNLVLALVASLAIVLFLVLVVVRPTAPAAKAVDYRAAASESHGSVSEPLAVPDLPKGWSANSATLDTDAGGVETWNIGLLTPDHEYIGLVQGIKADRTWVSNAVKQTPATGKATVGGASWLTYDRRESSDPGNYAYSMSTTLDHSSVVLHGTANAKEFRMLATAVLASLPAPSASR